MKKGLLSIALFFWLTTATWAQEKKIYTLKECVEIALQNNLSVKRSELGLKGADINLDQSKLTLLPSLNLSGSTGSNFGRSIDPTTNAFIDQKIDNANVSASASLLLFNAFRVMNTIRQTINEKAATEGDLNKAKNDVILSVVSFYTAVIFNNELLQNAQLQLRITQQQLERTKKLEKAGSVPLGNVLDLEAQNATNELTLVQRENNYNLSLLQLKQAMQLPASTPLQVEVPDISIDAVTLNQSPEEIFDIAKQNMPEIKAAIYRTQSSDFALRAANANLYPRLSLNASAFTNYSSAAKIANAFSVVDPNPQIGYVGTDPATTNPALQVRSLQPQLKYTLKEKPFSDQFSDNISQGISLGLTIPLFNGYATRASVLRSRVQKQQASINLTDAENKLRQAIETAYNDASSAAKTYVASSKAVSAREEAFRMTKQRYDAGATNYVDYQVSENNLFQAKSDQVRAKYDFIFKRKVLDFYQGKPIYN